METGGIRPVCQFADFTDAVVSLGKDSGLVLMFTCPGVPMLLQGQEALCKALVFFPSYVPVAASTGG